MIAEHNRVVPFNKSSTLLMGWYELVMQSYTFVMGSGNDFQATIFNRGIAKIIVEKNYLRPWRGTEWIVPLHPILVPV